MAGAGFKTFASGEVLTAANVNTYLMQQTVMVFADSSARSTALGANVSEGMLSYLKDTNQVEVYNGSAWVASDDPNAIQNTIVDAKGDLISATAADTPARLAVGTNGQFLAANSSTSTGLEWQTISAGGMTELATSTATGSASVTFSSISGSYKHLFLKFVDVYISSDGEDLNLTLNSDTGFNYSYYIFTMTGTTIGANQSQGAANYRTATVMTNSSTADNRNAGYFYIYDYAQTGYPRLIQSGVCGYLLSGSARNRTGQGFWKNTANAVNSLTLTLGAGTISGGKFTLYGVS